MKGILLTFGGNHMALKDVMKSLIGKKESRRETGITAGIEAGMEAEVQGGTPGEQGMFLTSDSFPIFPASAVDLSRYRSFPLTDLAALGIAFSTLPDAARTITQTATTHIATDMPIFAGLWPEGVAGRMLDRGPGFSATLRTWMAAAESWAACATSCLTAECR